MTENEAGDGFELSAGVSFRVIGGCAIFLDEHRDRYVRFTRSQTKWFDEIRMAHGRPGLSGAALTFAERLLKDGLIQSADNPGNVITECCLGTASKSAYDKFYHSESTFPVSQVPGFFLAWVDSRRIEGTRGLSGVLDKVRHLKNNLKNLPPAPEAEAVFLASCAHSLAPFFLDTHDACRFRSLLLIRFLAMHGIGADWVFGVRVAPFRAHCWVEYQDTVLNEFRDQTAEFQKILSV